MANDKQEVGLKVLRLIARVMLVCSVLAILINLTGAKTIQWMPFWIAGGLYGTWRTYEEMTEAHD